MTAPRPSQTVVQLPADDCVVVFRTELSGVYGRLVRLGAVSQKILKPHALPPVAATLLGEATALAALLGSALGDTGNIAVQTKTDGIVSVIYADCEAPGQLRGYARMDTGTFGQLTAAGEVVDAVRALGQGHLAITIDAGGDAERYQGVIALDGGALADGAARYFEQREALPTFIRLAVAQHYASARNGTPADVQWRGGGIMMQFPRPASGRDDDTPGDEDDPWERVRLLTATIEDHELLDPNLTAERLLLRLFHEEGVVIERVVPLTAYCKCSREKIANVLATFGDDDIKDMVDDAGKIAVTCEFCATTYAFDAADIGAAGAP
ncbi:MAG TPA: Hsp33 family molecular chaperone HslO [Hyphomicrobium sp.]|nr:Hsp33 family molecular chaperone HslO [Hyphomicrobium sp.]